MDIEDALWSGLGGMFLVPIIWMGTGHSLNWTVVLIGAFGPLVFFVIQSAWNGYRRAQERSAKMRMAERNRVREDRVRKQQQELARQERRDAELDRIKHIPAQLVASYGAAEDKLSWAARELGAAQNHRSAGAFTPFWEAVERCTMALNGYRIIIGQIEELSDDYQRSISKRPLEDVHAFEPLPLGVGDSGPLDAGSDIAGRLGRLVYDAQSDYRFASIFEQRRTTAAVIEGFGSLSNAIFGMSGSIRSAIEELSTHVASSSGNSSALGRGVSPVTEPVYLLSEGTFGGQIVAINRNLEAIGRGLSR